jgi:hypothetical protein
MSSDEGKKSARNAINPGPTRTRLVKCPYKVLLGGVIVDEFYDIRDAIASAHVLKTSHPNQFVKVTDEPSGRLIVEI